MGELISLIAKVWCVDRIAVRKRWFELSDLNQKNVDFYIINCYNRKSELSYLNQEVK